MAEVIYMYVSMFQNTLYSILFTQNNYLMLPNETRAKKLYAAVAAH